jgi:hypothetical protein
MHALQFFISMFKFPKRKSNNIIESAGGLRAHRSFMQLVWLCCISVMWTERNNRVFKATETTIHQMFDKVKLHSL